MTSTIVFQTNSETATQKRTRMAAIARILDAPTYVPVDTYGLCTACGAIETRLNKVTGTRDFSSIGEAADYPTGYGCELCS